MQKQALESLLTMYRLFSRVNGLSILTAAFKMYVQVGMSQVIDYATTEIFPSKRPRTQLRILLETTKWLIGSSVSNRLWIN